MPEPFYITTPIYYVNDVPHIGHAYTTVAADAAARYRRMMGSEVFFLTGTDEHGQKVEKSAAEQGVSPKALADRVVTRFQKLWDALNISHDDFIRTTDARHEEAVQTLWRTVAEKGDIYLGEYEDWYCTPCETFLTALQLEEGKCPDCGGEPEQLKEESYFFRMSRYEQRLLVHLEEHPEFIQPESRRNEIIQFVRGGLKDLSISRTTFSWGIPVPGNDRHVIYVWFDALTNYLSALGYPSRTERFGVFWPADVHVIGKDILRFHAVYWPTFLMAAELPLPRQVFSHGWWTVDGEKMSKSKGNVVDPVEMVRRYGADPFRYFLLREVPFGLDGDFSEKAMVGRFNADLANDLGNLFSRVTAMLSKYCEGIVPRADTSGDLAAQAERAVQRVDEEMEHLAFHKALQEIWVLINGINRYVDQKAPWVLAREASRRPELDGVMASLMEALRVVTLLISPFMPVTAEQAAAVLGLQEGWCTREGLRWGASLTGVEIAKAKPLFPRIDTEETPRKAPGQPSPAGAKQTEQVTLQEFSRLDLRTGVIREAEAVAKSERLLKLQVDLGETGSRQVVAGIAEVYAPDDVIGKTVVVLCNLKPAKLMGIESQGMILAVEGENGLSLLGLDRPVLPGRKIN
jgi:methionyl-tRNA synthetase